MNNSYLFNLILIFLTISITFASNLNVYNQLKKQKSQQRKTLIESLSHKIVNYFDVNKYLTFINEESFGIIKSNNEKKCDSIDEINDYFFKVYGENDTIHEKDLNHMIKYQITGLKDEDIDKKTKRKACRRRKVFY
jgi:hypothetical protein